jgi:hypothetical protein
MRKRRYFGFHFLGYTNFRQQDLLKNIFSAFIIAQKAKFQLEVNENKVVIISPTKFTNPLKSIHGPLDPKLRNGLNVKPVTGFVCHVAAVVLRM